MVGENYRNVGVRQATRTVWAALQTATAMSPPTFSASESLSDSDRGQTTTVVNKWGTSATNRRPVDDPIKVVVTVPTALFSMREILVSNSDISERDMMLDSLWSSHEKHEFMFSLYLYYRIDQIKLNCHRCLIYR